MIFVDSNIPMYVAGAEHRNRPRALRLLERVRTGELEACTSTEVLQEILYRYVGLGQVALAQQVYDLFVQICHVIFPVTLTDTDRVRNLLTTKKGISVRDALHAAVMLNNDVLQIATFDQGFDKIPGVKRLRLP